MAGADDESQAQGNSSSFSPTTLQQLSGVSESFPVKIRGTGHRGSGKHANKCSTCGKSFKKPSDLIRHVRIHTGEKPFKCEMCHRVFTVKSTLDSHRKTHGPAKKTCKCAECGSSFATKGSLVVHMRLHSGSKPFKCPHCNLCFRTSGHRKSHVAQHFKTDSVRARRTTKARKEGQCEMVFVNGQALASSEQMDISGVAAGETDIADSSQVISIDPALLQTQGVVPLSVSVTDVFCNAANNDVAMQVLQGGIQLQVAGQQAILTGVDNGSGVITQPIQLDAALLQQLQQGNINLCIDQKTNSSNAVVIPNAMSSSLTEAVAPNFVIKSGVDPELTIIQSAFGNEAILQGIGTAVVGENLLDQLQVQPSSSEAKLMSASYADSDEVDDGDNVASFDCGDGSFILGQKFMAASGQVEPETSEEQRNYVCGECGKAFKRQGHLTEHKQTHSGQKDNAMSRSKQFVHTCQHCAKSFCKPSQLERHIRIHTGERPFVCMECGRAFNQKNALDTHTKKHRGERPHKCTFCEMAFTQKGNLKTHINRAHRTEPSDADHQSIASASNAAELLL